MDSDEASFLSATVDNYRDDGPHLLFNVALVIPQLLLGLVVARQFCPCLVSTYLLYSCWYPPMGSLFAWYPQSNDFVGCSSLVFGLVGLYPPIASLGRLYPLINDLVD